MNEILLRNQQITGKIDQKIKWHKGKLCVPTMLQKLRSLRSTSMPFQLTLSSAVKACQISQPNK